MDVEGRKRYRVTPDEAHTLAITVKTAEGETFTGELLDITIDGAGTRFPRDIGPTLAVGQPATLTFTSLRLRKPIQVNAKVRSRVELGAFRSYRYGFEFSEWQELQRRLSGEIHELFNQRMSYRVEPDPAQPIEAIVKLTQADRLAVHDAPPKVPEEFKAVASVKDISAIGTAILIDREAEVTLAATDVVEVSFQLPISDKTVELVSWIRNRQLQDESVCYGLEFDADRSEYFERQQNEIIKYITRRRLEEPPKRLR
jgi:c-di-GMP-binding flagellar brake protein YcgR